MHKKERFAILHYILDLVESIHLREGEKIWEPKSRMEKLYLIMEGEVEYQLMYNDTPYYKQAKGSFFGLEDYIYRLPEETRHELNDHYYFFSDYRINIWYKRKFKVKTRCRMNLLAIDLY